MPYACFTSVFDVHHGPTLLDFVTDESASLQDPIKRDDDLLASLSLPSGAHKCASDFFIFQYEQRDVSVAYETILSPDVARGAVLKALCVVANGNEDVWQWQAIQQELAKSRTINLQECLMKCKEALVDSENTGIDALQMTQYLGPLTITLLRQIKTSRKTSEPTRILIFTTPPLQPATRCCDWLARIANIDCRYNMALQDIDRLQATNQQWVCTTSDALLLEKIPWTLRLELDHQLILSDRVHNLVPSWQDCKIWRSIGPMHLQNTIRLSTRLKIGLVNLKILLTQIIRHVWQLMLGRGQIELDEPLLSVEMRLNRILED